MKRGASLTPRRLLKPRERVKNMLEDGRTDDLIDEMKPDPEVLRIAGLDMTEIDDASLSKEIDAIAEIAWRAAESDAGMDDLDALDRWHFDRTCSAALVYRLCQLIRVR
jgi:hypothetical protein